MQIEALGLMMAGVNFTDIAKQLGVNRSVLYDWFRLPTFQAAYHRLLDQAKKDLESRLFALHTKAIATLDQCLESDNPQIAFKAALHILEHARQKSVGKLDARDIMKAQCTTKRFDDKSFQTIESFAIGRYQQWCKELGIAPDVD